MTNNDWIPYGPTPDGYYLYWKPNVVGGRVWATDELMAEVWDTAITSESTLLAAIVAEQALNRKEDYERRD